MEHGLDARVFPEGHYRKGVFLEAGFATRQGWMTAISQEVDRGSNNWESKRAVCRAGVLLKRIPDGAFGQGTRWRIELHANSRLDFDFIFPEAVLDGSEKFKCEFCCKYRSYALSESNE